MTIANREHDLVCRSGVRPSCGRIAPVGLMKIRDAETGHEQWIDTSSRAVRRAHHDWWVNKQAELNETFTKSNVDNVSVRTDQDYVKALMNLFAETEINRKMKRYLFLIALLIALVGKGSSPVGNGRCYD